MGAPPPRPARTSASAGVTAACHPGPQPRSAPASPAERSSTTSTSLAVCSAVRTSRTLEPDPAPTSRVRAAGPGRVEDLVAGAAQRTAPTSRATASWKGPSRRPDDCRSASVTSESMTAAWTSWPLDHEAHRLGRRRQRAPCHPSALRRQRTRLATLRPSAPRRRSAIGGVAADRTCRRRRAEREEDSPQPQGLAEVERSVDPRSSGVGRPRDSWAAGWRRAGPERHHRSERAASCRWPGWRARAGGSGRRGLAGVEALLVVRAGRRAVGGQDQRAVALDARETGEDVGVGGAQGDEARCSSGRPGRRGRSGPAVPSTARASRLRGLHLGPSRDAAPWCTPARKKTVSTSHQGAPPGAGAVPGAAGARPGASSAGRPSASRSDARIQGRR